jgi:predicted metal-dependent phosphotriesterase family hydrolase
VVVEDKSGEHATCTVVLAGNPMRAAAAAAAAASHCHTHHPSSSHMNDELMNLQPQQLSRSIGTNETLYKIVTSGRFFDSM